MAHKLFTAALILQFVLTAAAKAQMVEPSDVRFASDSYDATAFRRLPPISEVDDDDPQLDAVEELPAAATDTSADARIVDPPAPPPRRGTPAGFGGPFARNNSPVGFTTQFDPSVSLKNQAGSFTHWGEELRLGDPIWKSEPHLLLATSSVGVDHFDTPIVFPTSGTVFPETLWNIRFGTFYMHRYECGWNFGAGLNVGSGSDVPFGDLRDVNPAVFAFLNVPRPGENAWNFAIFYSPLSEIPFPIPGVSYHWHAYDALQMNIGLPAQIVYQPTDAFVFTASYMLLTTVNVRGTWYVDDNWSIYTAYESRNRSWFLHDRVNDDERLFAYEQGLFVGVQRPVWKRLKADVSAGYLFDRSYFLGEDFDDRNNDRIDIESGATVAAQLGIAF